MARSGPCTSPRRSPTWRAGLPADRGGGWCGAGLADHPDLESISPRSGRGLLRYEKTLLRGVFSRADYVLLSQLSGIPAAAIGKAYAQLSHVLGARLSPAAGGPTPASSAPSPQRSALMPRRPAPFHIMAGQAPVTEADSDITADLLATAAATAKCTILLSGGGRRTIFLAAGRGSIRAGATVQPASNPFIAAWANTRVNMPKRPCILCWSRPAD